MRAPAINPRASTCPDCGRVYSSAVTVAVCPKDADQRRETARAERLLGIEKVAVDNPRTNRPAWDNRNGPRGAINTAEGLTHISDLAERG